MLTSRTILKVTEFGIISTAVATLILAGCGGGGSSSSNNYYGTPTMMTTTVTPFKGMFQSGTVTLFDANGNQVSLSAGGNINASGVASVTFPASVTYPLTVCVNGAYLDETQGNTPVSMGAGTCLRGLVPSASEAASGVPVTAVTEIARAMLPASGVTYASAVAAITGTASSVLGTTSYTQAMQPPVFNGLGRTTDPQTIRLAALAHVINQHGTGGNLVLRLQNLTASLVAGSAVNAVFPQATFASAVAVVNSTGASGVLPVSATPPTVTIPSLPGGSLGGQIQAGIPTCAQGQVLTPSATGLQCVTGGTGGGTGGITCNTAHYQAGTVRQPTGAEMAAYAQSYSAITGTNDPVTFQFTATGSATLSLSTAGVLTLNGQPHPATSICMDNAGDPLYVEFGTMDHVDLNSNGHVYGFLGATSTILQPSGTGGGGGGSNNSLAVKQGGFNLGVPLANLPANLAGTYDVAIYTALPESGQAASSVTGYLGLAKLVVRNTTGSNYALELKTPSGTLISRNTNDSSLSLASAFGFQVSSNGGTATIGGSNGTALPTSVTASFGTDGTITGNASGNFGIGMIAFRNNITHFGPTVAPAFSALAGNWAGQAEALTCGQPQVTLSIATDSNLTIGGKPNLSCTQTSYSANWDGNDDYIIPDGAGGYKLVINANQYAATVVNGQITGPGPGALTLMINDPTAPTTISNAQLNYGSGGFIQSVALTKQATGGGSTSGVSLTSLGTATSYTPATVAFIQGTGSLGATWTLATNSVSLNIVKSLNGLSISLFTPQYSYTFDDPSGACLLVAIQNTSIPQCTAKGIIFDNVAGTISFANVSMVSSNLSAPPITLDGSLSFTPF